MKIIRETFWTEVSNPKDLEQYLVEVDGKEKWVLKTELGD